MKTTTHASTIIKCAIAAIAIASCAQAGQNDSAKPTKTAVQKNSAPNRAKGDANQLKKKNKELEKINMQLKNQIVKARGHINELEQEIVSLRNELERLKDENEMLNEKLKANTADKAPKPSAKNSQKPAATLQRCGTSMRKTEYIKDFAAKVMSGELDIAAIAGLPDAEVIAALSSLRGIGVWTAEMLLLFTMQRPDILSFGDLGIHRGMRMVYRHRKITKELFEKYRRCLSPYGSVASLYFWAVAGGAIPGLTDPAAKCNNPKTKGKTK